MDRLVWFLALPKVDALIVMFSLFNDDFIVELIILSIRILPRAELKLKLYSYSGPILVCLSNFKLSIRNYLAVWLILLFAIIDWIGYVSIFRSSSFSFLALQGVSFVSIS
jgi:hypothetical protein